MRQRIMPLPTRHPIGDDGMDHALGAGETWTLPIRVLVVEDDDLTRMMIVELLDERGYDVVEASSGTEALRLLAKSAKFDLLLTDINIPVPNGIDLARRAEIIRPCIKVLFMTGEPEVPELCGLTVEHRSLSKPFGTVRLIEAISDLVGVAFA